MSSSLIRLGFAILIATIALYLIGCGGAKKDEGGVMELLAQAQQLQQAEKYDDAIRTYRKIADEFPKTHQAANAQFMVGYIYANHIKDFEQAKIELNRFLKDFAQIADSGLVVGAKFELEYLGKDIEEIPVLKEMGSVDTVAVEGDAGKKK